MRFRTSLVLPVGLVLAVGLVSAQPPPGGRGKQPPSGASGASDPVARMMAFDKNKDGKLTRDEITDKRLLRLFDRADANKDGVVTREELTALFAREALPAGGFGPPGGGPPGGGFGPPGRGGPPGKGRFGGPRQPGQILPGFVQGMLELTDDQKKQLADLQKEVNHKLEQILTQEQRKQLREMGRGGRGFGPPPGFGPPGPGGRRGPGQPPAGRPPEDRPKQ